VSLQAIAYVSSASPNLSPQRLEGIVGDAIAYNEMAGVTGVLLYDGQRFLQYIEGAEDAIVPIYARIVSATSHHELVELGRSKGELRLFPQWSMHWVRVSVVDLRIAVSSDWRSFGRQRANVPSQVPSGIDRMASLAGGAGR
jgi:hypothetical protein